jgi:surfactin synthase thioesterase subunit
MKSVLGLASFLIVLIFLPGCKKQSLILKKKAAIIGFDPCLAMAPQKRYILKIENDTLIAENLETTGLDIPPESFENYQFSYYFSGTQQNNYYITISYRYAKPEEVQVPLCRGDINVAGLQKIPSIIIISKQ